MTTVKIMTTQGNEVSFNAAVALMDDEIREQLHFKYAGELTEQEFYDMYVKEHEEKYGEEFMV